MARAATQQHNQCLRLGGLSAPQRPVPAVRPDTTGAQESILKRSLEKATARRAFWQRNVERAEASPGGPFYARNKPGRRKGAMWKSHRKALRELDRAGDVEDRAIQNLERFYEMRNAGEGGLLVVRGRKSRKRRVGLSNIASLRVRLYGGVAELQRYSGGWSLVLTNNEPHARWVERGWPARIGRPGNWLYANGLRLLSSTGVRRVSRVAHERLARVWEGS
jgi:hypothetical protein